jgi:hypothetical protein
VEVTAIIPDKEESDARKERQLIMYPYETRKQ